VTSKANYYFDNPAVEALLVRYIDGACTDIKLRDEIMGHAATLIKAVIRKHDYGRLLQYKHRTNDDDLAAVAWNRIEKTLYKFESGRAKVFSMWTQIVVLVCLAHVKKETRDAVAVRKWRDGHPAPLFDKAKKPDFYGIMDQLRAVCAHQTLYLEMIDYLVELYRTDDQAHFGIVKKLSAKFTREKAQAFLLYLRLRRVDVDL